MEGFRLQLLLNYRGNFSISSFENYHCVVQEWIPYDAWLQPIHRTLNTSEGFIQPESTMKGKFSVPPRFPRDCK